jgi:hypothetical protein
MHLVTIIKAGQAAFRSLQAEARIFDSAPKGVEEG